MKMSEIESCKLDVDTRLNKYVHPLSKADLNIMAAEFKSIGFTVLENGENELVIFKKFKNDEEIAFNPIATV